LDFISGGGRKIFSVVAAFRADAAWIFEATINRCFKVPRLKKDGANFVAYQRQMATMWARVETQRSLAGAAGATWLLEIPYRRPDIHF
jgi:hypothetical protein